MSTIDTMPDGAVVPKPSFAAMGFGLSDLYRWFRLRMEKRRSRLDLAELTDDQLRDIGLTRQDAARESERPFWN